MTEGQKARVKEVVRSAVTGTRVVSVSQQIYVNVKGSVSLREMESLRDCLNTHDISANPVDGDRLQICINDWTLMEGLHA